jgi:hypothetical protein
MENTCEKMVRDCEKCGERYVESKIQGQHQCSKYLIKLIKEVCGNHNVDQAIARLRKK